MACFSLGQKDFFAQDLCVVYVCVSVLELKPLESDPDMSHL